MTSPFKIYAATRSAINHAHAQWAAATRPIHHGVGVGVGGAPAAGDSAHVAAYRERWRCIISSASCGRRQLEQDRPAAPGHSVVNSMVGCQAVLVLLCWAKNTQKSTFSHKYDDKVIFHSLFSPHHRRSSWLRCFHCCTLL